MPTDLLGLNGPFGSDFRPVLIGPNFVGLFLGWTLGLDNRTSLDRLGLDNRPNFGPVERK